MSAGQGDVEEPSGPKVTGAWRRAETTGGCKNQPKPIGRNPQDTAHLSAGSTQNNPTHDRLRLAAEGLESARRVEMLGETADFCSPTKAAVGLLSFSELLGAYLVGVRRTVFVTSSRPSTGSCALRSLGLAAAQGDQILRHPHWPHHARAADLLECGGAWLLRGNSALFLCYANPPSRLPSDSENEFPGDSQHGRRQRMGMGTDGEKRRICC